KQAAFNSLTDEEEDLIIVTPKDSILEKITVNDNNKSFIGKDYDKVYSVTFNNTETDSSGKLMVFVGLDKETVVGKALQANKIYPCYQM
ncbi:MAG TPA: hypothetical protein VIR64_08760, partial [Pseudobacillus sp.]